MSADTQALSPREQQLYGAVKYVLDRIQQDPDLMQVMLFTEAHRRLIEVEAAVLGEPVVTAENRRRKDLQPPHRRRKAKVVELQEELDELRDGCS